MNANRPASAHNLGSDLEQVDLHRIAPSDYEELPELTEVLLPHGVFKRAGRPVARDPRQQVTIRLPASVLARWKASGPGWQRRMAELLGNAVPPSGA